MPSLCKFFYRLEQIGFLNLKWYQLQNQYFHLAYFLEWNFWICWQNGWVFVYQLIGCVFESNGSHLNFRFRACFKQGVPWHSGNYSVWIHSETRARHDQNIQLKIFRSSLNVSIIFSLFIQIAAVVILLFSQRSK